MSPHSPSAPMLVSSCLVCLRPYWAAPAIVDDVSHGLCGDECKQAYRAGFRAALDLTTATAGTPPPMVPDLLAQLLPEILTAVLDERTDQRRDAAAYLAWRWADTI